MDKIVQGFPHKNITPIIGNPTYGTIKEVNLLLSTKVVSIHSHRENGQLGHLVLTIALATYATITCIAFIPPPNPGPTLTIPANARVVIIKNM